MIASHLLAQHGSESAFEFLPPGTLVPVAQRHLTRVAFILFKDAAVSRDESAIEDVEKIRFGERLLDMARTGRGRALLDRGGVIGGAA